MTILGDRHAELCRLFSTKGADRFAAGDWSTTRAGHHIPADGLGWLDCRITTVHPAGDHELVIAEALEGALTEQADPLVFHAGRFTALAAA